MRKIPSMDNLLPVLYLKGISTNSFRDALAGILGEGAAGLSAANILRLKKCWEDDFKQWHSRDLSNKKYAYIWVDGIHLNVRLQDDRCCVLVIIGADEAGNKELLAVSDGYRAWLRTRRSFLTFILSLEPTVFISELRTQLNQLSLLFGCEPVRQRAVAPGSLRSPWFRNYALRLKRLGKR